MGFILVRGCREREEDQGEESGAMGVEEPGRSGVYTGVPTTGAGEVAERLNALDSKSSMASGSSGVRIPPSPLR